MSYFHLSSEFGCGEEEAMLFYLVPEGKLRKVEKKNDAQKNSKVWSAAADAFRNTSLEDSAKSVTEILQAMPCVSVSSGLVTVEGDMKSAVGIHTLVKGLSSGSTRAPGLDAFIKRLKSVCGEEIPEATTA